MATIKQPLSRTAGEGDPREARRVREGEAMYRYIIKRLLLVIPTLVGAAALVFLLMRLIPGDICVVRLGSGGGTFDERAVQACHAQLGLDRPIFLQFVDFVWGSSAATSASRCGRENPSCYEIAARFPVSLEIAIMAVVIANVIAIPLGTISALKQNSPIDLVIRVFSIAGLATPSFWLGILFILAILDFSQAASARRGCRRSTMCRYGRIRCAICRWLSFRR